MKRVLSPSEKAKIDLALERGVNPSQLSGGFAWASLIPLLPLLQPLTKPVEKVLDRGTDKLLDWVGLGFAPTGANYVPFQSPPCSIIPQTPAHQTLGGAMSEAEALHHLKNKLIPYVNAKYPNIFKNKLKRMIRKAKAIHKANGTLDAVMTELEKKQH